MGEIGLVLLMLELGRAAPEVIGQVETLTKCPIDLVALVRLNNMIAKAPVLFLDTYACVAFDCDCVAGDRERRKEEEKKKN